MCPKISFPPYIPYEIHENSSSFNLKYETKFHHQEHWNQLSILTLPIMILLERIGLAQDAINQRQ